MPDILQLAAQGEGRVVDQSRSQQPVGALLPSGGELRASAHIRVAVTTTADLKVMDESVREATAAIAAQLADYSSWLGQKLLDDPAAVKMLCAEQGQLAVVLERLEVSHRGYLGVGSQQCGACQNEARFDHSYPCFFVVCCGQTATLQTGAPQPTATRATGAGAWANPDN